MYDDDDDKHAHDSSNIQLDTTLGSKVWVLLYIPFSEDQCSKKEIVSYHPNVQWQILAELCLLRDESHLWWKQKYISSFHS